MIKRYYISELDDINPNQQVILFGQILLAQTKQAVTILTIDDHTSTIECDLFNNTIVLGVGDHVKIMGDFYQKGVFGGSLNKIKIQKLQVIDFDEAALCVIEINCQNNFLKKTLKSSIDINWSQGGQVIQNEQRKQVELQTILLKFMYVETQIIYTFTQCIYSLAQNMEMRMSEPQILKMKLNFNLDQLYKEIQQMLVEWNLNESKVMIQARIKDAMFLLCKTKHVVKIKEECYGLNIKENLEFFYIALKKIQARQSLKIKQITEALNGSYEGFISQTIDTQTQKAPTLFSDQLFYYITNILIEKHILFENGPGKVSSLGHFFDLDKQFEEFIHHVQQYG